MTSIRTNLWLTADNLPSSLDAAADKHVPPDLPPFGSLSNTLDEWAVPLRVPCQMYVAFGDNYANPCLGNTYAVDGFPPSRFAVTEWCA